VVELSPPDPRIGQVLQGRYRILARVAAGAMGVVYRGERVELRRPVAVKFLHPWIAAQPAFRARFETEARAMSRLGHPNCVSVIDFGLEGSPYVVMDFVAGSTLRQLLQSGPLSPPRAVAITRQLLAGVAHAHAQAIIHRDLKPENLILGDAAGLADHVRILDFGLAKLRDGPAMTSGLAIGTPSYMSPEQTGAPGEIDGRTDIYAVGIILFEMIAGRKPFVSDKVADILLMHRDSPPPSLREAVPGGGVSRELEAVVNRALAKSPDTRFQTAAEFAQALDQVPEAVAARAAGTFPSAPSSSAAAPTSSAPTYEGDRTILDPTPSHLSPPTPESVPPPASAPSASAPGPASASAPSPLPFAQAPGVEGDRGTGRPGGTRLAGAGWIGLGAVAAVALALVFVGLRRHPAAPDAARRAGSAGAGVSASSAAVEPVVAEPKATAPVPVAIASPVTSAPVAPSSVPGLVPGPGAPAPVVPSVDERLTNADRLIAAGEWEQALVVLQKARREKPDSAVVAYQLANLSLEHKRWGEGAQAARVAAERDPKYRSDERLVRNLVRSLASDKGYERSEDVLHGFGAGPVPFLKDAAAHDKNPTVRQRAAELLRSRESGRGPSRPSNRSSTSSRKSSSHSLFSR
jgi:serine/threonine protein kinase